MSNFNFYLNRQGVRGKKGDKGDQGFSPNISIKTDTPTEFIMTVNNEFDSFNTPNLIPTAIGEKVTELEATLTTHTQQITDLTTEVEADKAIIEANTGDIENLQTKQQEHTSRLEALDNQIFGIRKDVTQQAGWIGQLQVSDSDKTTKIAELQTGKQNKLVAGENITLTDNTDGTTTISSEGGSGGGELPDNVAFTDIGNIFTDNTQSIAMGHYSHTGLEIGQKIIYPDGTAHVDLSKPSASISGISINFSGAPEGTIPTITSSGGELNISARNLTINNQIPVTENKLKAGENVSITKDVTSGNITISAIGGASESEIDKVIESSSTTNSVVLTPKDGKTLDLSGAPMIAVGENLVNNIDGENHQLYLKQGDVKAGENITVEKTATGITISSTGGGSGEVPANMVTTDTVQTITGQKSFELAPLLGSNMTVGSSKRLLTSEIIDDFAPFEVTAYNGGGYPAAVSTTLDLAYGASNRTAAIRTGIATYTLGGAREGVLGFGSSSTALTNSFTLQGNGASTGKTNFKLIAKQDSLTYTTSDGVVHDLLAAGGGETPDLSNYAQLNTSTKQIFTGENVFNNTNTYIKSGGNITFSGTGNAYRYGSISGAYDTLTLNAGGNASNGKLTLLGNIEMRGVTRPTFGGEEIALKSDITSGGGSSVADKNGIEADYKVKHGIIDCPNGLIKYSASNKDIVIKQGLVLNCAGNGTAKTTISADIPYTVGNSIPFTLFYAQGNLLECPDVYWQEEEPESNGQTGYQAWWNPNKETNPDQQWQFRSNDTGNVFRTVTSATPIADINAGADFITSVSYLGYRVMDDDILIDTNNVQTITARKIFMDGALFRSIMDSDRLAVNSKMVTGAKGTLHLSDTDGISLKTDTGINGNITLDAENGNIEIYAGANKTLNVITATNSGMMVQESDNVILSNQSHSLHVNSDGLFVDGSNDKQVVDKSMSEYIGYQAMPATTYTSFTLGASGASYTAPADGYFLCTQQLAANGTLRMFTSELRTKFAANSAGLGDVWLPVRKGRTVTIQYTNITSGQYDEVRFYYNVGSEPTV